MEGKFRYTRCPQGACFAGEAYNRWHAAVTAEVPRKRKKEKKRKERKIYLPLQSQYI